MVETAIQVATIPTKPACPIHILASIAFISFAKGTRGSDQSEFTFLHLPLKIQTLSAGAGRDRARQPESNLKCGYNQEMDSSHQVIDNPNATILQKKDKIVNRTLHSLLHNMRMLI